MHAEVETDGACEEELRLFIKIYAFRSGGVLHGSVESLAYRGSESGWIYPPSVNSWLNCDGHGCEGEWSCAENESVQAAVRTSPRSRL